MKRHFKHKCRKCGCVLRRKVTKSNIPDFNLRLEWICPNKCFTNQYIYIRNEKI